MGDKETLQSHKSHRQHSKQGPSSGAWRPPHNRKAVGPRPQAAKPGSAGLRRSPSPLPRRGRRGRTVTSARPAGRPRPPPREGARESAVGERNGALGHLREGGPEARGGPARPGGSAHLERRGRSAGCCGSFA